MPRETMLTVGEVIDQLQMYDRDEIVHCRIPVEGTPHVYAIGFYGIDNNEGRPELVTWGEGCERHYAEDAAQPNCENDTER